MCDHANFPAASNKLFKAPRSPAVPAAVYRVNILVLALVRFSGGRKPNHRLQFGPKSAPISSNQESISLQTTISKSGRALARRGWNSSLSARRGRREHTGVCIYGCVYGVECFIDQRAARANECGANGSLKIGAAHRIPCTSRRAGRPGEKLAGALINAEIRIGTLISRDCAAAESDANGAPLPAGRYIRRGVQGARRLQITSSKKHPSALVACDVCLPSLRRVIKVLRLLKMQNDIAHAPQSRKSLVLFFHHPHLAEKGKS